jgi:hypothetical protein
MHRAKEKKYIYVTVWKTIHALQKEEKYIQTEKSMYTTERRIQGGTKYVCTLGRRKDLHAQQKCEKDLYITIRRKNIHAEQKKSTSTKRWSKLHITFNRKKKKYRCIT